MQADAQIICRRTSFGEVCDWMGGKVAIVDSQRIRSIAKRKIIQPGEVYSIGRLKVRTIGLAFSPGAYSDSMYVMLESPHAQLYWLYRQNAERLLRLVSNIEARMLGAWRGFRLKPIPEGMLLPMTSRLADRLL